MKMPIQSPIELFRMYMQVTGVPSLEDAPAEEPDLKGKKLGILNGASWIILWANFFGRMMLPGVKLINIGNEAVQLNFMKAHCEGKPCPPRLNIDKFIRYAEDLVELFEIDAILITCSTMNRSTRTVRKAMERHGIPVIQIDETVMEEAVARGGRILVIVTHSPTANSTRELLRETATRLRREVLFTIVTVEEAFRLLGYGDIESHNRLIAETIRQRIRIEKIRSVVLAQLSMSVFKFSYPDCEKSFGVPVLTAGEIGFLRTREVLKSL